MPPSTAPQPVPPQQPQPTPSPGPITSYDEMVWTRSTEPEAKSQIARLQLENGVVTLTSQGTQSQPGIQLFSIPAKEFSAVDISGWADGHTKWNVTAQGRTFTLNFLVVSGRGTVVSVGSSSVSSALYKRDLFIALMRPYAPAALPDSPGSGPLDANQIVADRKAEARRGKIGLIIGFIFLIAVMVFVVMASAK